MTTQEEVLFLLKHYLKVIEASKTPNSTNRLNKAQGLIAKCFEHCASTIYLLRGTFLDSTISFKDFGTVFVTARAALESLLTFSYVFYIPKTEVDFEYKYDIWVMSGLLDRQGFFPSENLIEENRMIVAVEKKQIEEIKLRINSNSDFIKLTDNQKDRVREGEWRPRSDSWVSIGVNIGFNESRIRMMYSYLCGQAHSGGLSGIQYNYLVTSTDEANPGVFVEPLIAVILANMINMFCALFPKSKEAHEADQQAVELVKAYMVLGQSPFEVFS